MKTRVLILYPAPYYGSVWTVCRDLINHIDADRFEMHVATHRGCGGDIGLRPNRAQVTHHALRLDGPGLRKLGAAGGLAASLAALAAYVRRERIEVLHCSENGSSALLGVLLKAATGARLLVHYHTVPDLYSGSRQAVMKWTARAADCNVGVSRYAADQVRKLGGPSTRVDYATNGVDVEAFHPDVDGSAVRREYGIAPDAPLVVMLARVAQEKRQEDLVRALALARREVPALRALVVGWDDPRYLGPHRTYREELTALARELGVADALVLDVARPDAARLHAAADISVLTSPVDAFGLVVAEAMACGKPVVGVNAGGVPEIIEDGVTGLLVPPRDPQALAARIVELARAPELRARMGRAARAAAVASFSPRNVARQFEGVYGRLVERR